MTVRKTVIVVGAGLSGLRAASLLLKHRNIRVIVLEGRSRIGGRTHTSTTHSWSTPLDLGCAWIHGTQNNPLTPIAEAVSSKYYELESTSLWDAPGWVPEKTTRDIVDFIFSLSAEAVEFSKAHHKNINPLRSFYSFCTEKIDNHHEFNAIDKERAKKLAHFYTNVTAEEVTLQSLRNYRLEEELPGDSPMIASTYAPLVHHIAQSVLPHIELDAKVTHIRHSDAFVQVEYIESGIKHILDAAAVIVTVPLGVLKAESISFEPVLPQRITDAISHLGMGSAEKLYIKFRTAFWTDDMYAFLPASGDESLIEFISLAKFPVNSQPVLLCFSAANMAHKISTLWHAGGKGAVRDFVMQYIRRIPGYSDTAACEVEDLFITDWLHDEFSRGSYSYSPIGTLDTARDCDTFARGVPEHNLFFAGEHAASKEAGFEIGTAHGAYSSGEHTAKLVLAHLQQ